MWHLDDNKIVGIGNYIHRDTDQAISTAAAFWVMHYYPKAIISYRGIRHIKNSGIILINVNPGNLTFNSKRNFFQSLELKTHKHND